MKKNINVFLFTEQDSQNDILGMLDRLFIRHYGSLEIDGQYLEFVGTCSKSFTQQELNNAVRDKIKEVRETYLSNVSNENIAKFLDV